MVGVEALYQPAIMLPVNLAYILRCRLVRHGGDVQGLHMAMPFTSEAVEVYTLEHLEK